MASLKRNKLVNSSLGLAENTLDTVNELLLTMHTSLSNYRLELGATAPIQLQTAVAECIIEYNQLLKENADYIEGVPDLVINNIDTKECTL